LGSGYRSSARAGAVKETTVAVLNPRSRRARVSKVDEPVLHEYTWAITLVLRVDELLPAQTARSSGARRRREELRIDLQGERVGRICVAVPQSGFGNGIGRDAVEAPARGSNRP